MILSSVDLPAPLGPSSATTAPLGTVRSTPRSTSIRPYAACRSTTSRIGTLIASPPASLRSVDRLQVGQVVGRSASAVVGVAEVGLLHRAGRCGSRPACPEAMTAPKSRTWISSQTDITRSMSCSTMRIAAALGGQLAQQLAERLGLGLVQARGRLVEQQQPRVAGQAAGQLEQPGGAGRDRVGALVGVRRDADPLEQPVDVGRGGPDQPEQPARGCRGRPARSRGRSASRTPRAAGRCGPSRAGPGGAPACG